MTGSELIDDNQQVALMCMSVARADANVFETLYTRTAYSDVKRMQMLQTASEFREEKEDNGR